MKLRIERRGGLAGRAAFFETELASLSAAQRAALASVMATPSSAMPSPGADRFHFKVLVDDAAGARECEVPEDDMPDILACLVKPEV